MTSSSAVKGLTAVLVDYLNDADALTLGVNNRPDECQTAPNVSTLSVF